MKFPTAFLTSFVVATSLQGVELLTADGAWTDSGISASSNGGTQANSDANTAAFSYLIWNANNSFGTNAPGTYIEMQTDTGNPQQNYTAGYTYSYQARGYSAIDGHENTFNVQLLGNGSLVSGTQVTGNNFTTAGAPTIDSNIINGSYQVNGGDALVGQRIGMRINGNGVQTRFLTDSDTKLSALLTNHLGFDGGNGEGALYSSSFSGGAQSTAFDYVLGMTLSGNGVIQSDYVRINNNDVSQHTATFSSETDTFRAGTSYEITFVASRVIVNDATQDSLNIVLGGGIYTETIVMSGIADTYTITVDADAEGLAGESFRFDFLADSLTTSGVNQYRIYGFEVTAVPEPSACSPFAGALTLAWSTIRRRR